MFKLRKGGTLFCRIAGLTVSPARRNKRGNDLIRGKSKKEKLSWSCRGRFAFKKQKLQNTSRYSRPGLVYKF